MLPRYIKSRAEMIVKSFGINTREKVANFFGQLASESLRGLAEYVYYSKKGITNLGTKMSNYKEGDEEKFFYSDKNIDDGIPFGIKTPPWEKGGMFDTYYGGKYSPRTDLGNKFNKESLAKNDAGVVEPDEKINDYTVDPGFYKGSPEGYAYRGHGAIQITGKYQYERMNQFFGVNGKYEKNNVDFLEYPELVSYNWRSDLGGGPNGKDQNKFALLSALMWWNDHKGVQINQVSLSTTTTITKAVSNSESTSRNRHKNVERYYDFLLGGTVAKSLYSNVNYTPNNFKPGELKTREDVPQLSGRQKSSIFGHIEYEPLDNGRVRILNNFEQENIVFVEIPQLKKFGYNGTRFHKKGAEQLKRLWAEWQELGLLDGILTFSPSAFSPRYSKAKGSRSLSSHSWGVAFDINQRWNDLYETPAALGTKGSVRELVPSAIKWGFFWGGWWTGTPDGMHFEISRVLDPNTLKFV
jgi:predicted chitinase